MKEDKAGEIIVDFFLRKSCISSVAARVTENSPSAPASPNEEVDRWEECSWYTHKETSEVFSLQYRAITLLRIHFSADFITNTSSNIHLFMALGTNLLGMHPNMTYLWCWRICVKFLTYFCEVSI